MNQPGAAPQINPEVAAALQQQGIDVNKYLAQLQTQQFNAQLPFNQSMQQYSPLLDQAQQKAYNQLYGGTEQAGAQYAQSALSGEQTPLTRQMIADYGNLVGQQRGSQMSGLNQQMGQAGIDPNSPYAMALRQKQQSGLTSDYLRGAGNIANTQAQAGIGNAMNFLQMGQQSERLAGLKSPAIPKTAIQSGLMPKGGFSTDIKDTKNYRIPSYRQAKTGALAKEPRMTQAEWARAREEQHNGSRNTTNTTVYR